MEQEHICTHSQTQAGSAEGQSWPLALENIAALALVSHPVLKPNLTPEETPAMPAGSNLSLPAATPGQTAAPWSWDHHNTSRLLKIEAVTETCHAILLHSGHNAHLNIFIFKYFYNSNNNCCRQSTQTF